MTKKTDDTEQKAQEEIKQGVLAAEMAKPKRANKFQKIKELSELSDALESDKLAEFVLSMPSGRKIWELLTVAITQEVDGAMGNQEAMDAAADSLAQSLKNLGQLAGGIGSLATSINSLNNQVHSVNNAEVIRALGMMIKGRQTPPQQQVVQQQQQFAPQQQEPSGMPTVGSPATMIENAW